MAGKKKWRVANATHHPNTPPRVSQCRSRPAMAGSGVTLWLISLEHVGERHQRTVAGEGLGIALLHEGDQFTLRRLHVEGHMAEQLEAGGLVVDIGGVDLLA